MTMDDELEEFGERIDGAPPPSSFVDLMQRPEAKETIGRLVDLYRGRELLPGNRDVRLDCCCPKRESCWRDAPAPKDPKNSGISIPWLGANYFDHRILVAGINFNNLGGLHMHYGVIQDHIESMRRGKRGKQGRAFSRGAMRGLQIVVDSLAKVPSDDYSDATNEELADTWNQCAYLQAIKCSPGSPSSQPSADMKLNCPSFLLLRELEILKPRVVLLYGRSGLRDVVRPMLNRGNDAGLDWAHRMERDDLATPFGSCTVFSLNHPSSVHPYFDESLEELQRSLVDSPLTPLSEK